jgi:hypothetical protein
MAEISFQISAAPGITNDLIAVIYNTLSPSAEVDRIVVAPPHNSPANFQFSNLSSGVYIVKVHESTPGSGILGNLRHDWWEDASTNQILFERRFYTVDGLGTYDPTAGTVKIIDPYFSGKNITGVFQEGFRYLIPAVEWQQNSGGEVEWLGGISNSYGQVWSVEITYAQPATGGSQAIPFTDIVVVTADTTLTATEYDKCIYARASANKITITSPSIATIPDGKGFLIYHDGGNAINTIFKLPAGQIVRFMGQDRNSIPLGKGEFIKVIKKVISGTDYLFVTDHDGQWSRVGELIEGRQAIANGVYFDGTEYDLNVYVRLAEYVDGLPSNQIVSYTDYDLPSTINGEVVYPNNFFFAKDNVNNMVKVPKYLDQSVRYLKNIGGADSSRVTNIPGGYQHHKVGQWIFSGVIMQKSGTANQHVVLQNINDVNLGNQDVTFNTGEETRGRNVGFIPIMLI